MYTAPKYVSARRPIRKAEAHRADDSWPWKCASAANATIKDKQLAIVPPNIRESAACCGSYFSEAQARNVIRSRRALPDLSEGPVTVMFNAAAAPRR